MNQLSRNVIEDFRTRFQQAPRLFYAPGRINLIGEHTDYNEGFVMPFAIERGITVAASPRIDNQLLVHSRQLRDGTTIDLKAPERPRRGNWVDYIEGVGRCLASHGWHGCGANVVIESTLPMGSGLSSSAALEVAMMLALTGLGNAPLRPLDLVYLAQEVEHRFAGTESGIMDPFIVMFARQGSCLLLDCRSLQAQSIRLPDEGVLIACNTAVHHRLASSEYNLRRAQCRNGLRQIQQTLPGVTSLRGVDYSDFQKLESTITEPERRRCRHVLTENQRTIAAAAALQEGSLSNVGELMYASHESLRLDYEVSCAELDTLVDVSRSIQGVFGARMTGGGFGGCTIHLMRREAITEFELRTREVYRSKFGIVPEIFQVHPSDGAHEIA